MSGIGVDPLFLSVQELIKEKSCLEQALSDVRARRRELENERDAVCLKYAHAAEVDSKMHETLKVADSKVAQTQVQADSAQDLVNQKKKYGIDELKKRVTLEEDNYIEETQSFEDQVAELTDLFLDSKDFYTTENLEHKTEESEELRNEIVKTVECHESDIATLENDLATLKLEADTGDNVLPSPYIQAELIKTLMNEYAENKKNEQLSSEILVKTTRDMQDLKNTLEQLQFPKKNTESDNV